MKKLKVGIVGCGFVAQKRHIPGFLKLQKDLDSIVLCDLNVELVKKVANQFNISKTYSNLNEMLNNEQLDIIDICTPPKAHTSVAIEAMDHGCNVLMEKPMAVSVTDCDKMIESSKKNNVKLSIVHNQRFYPPFIKALKLVENGEIGEITGIRILSLTPKDEYMIHKDHWIHNLPGGVIGETGPHVIYMSLAFMKKFNDIKVIARKYLDYPWVLYDNYNIELIGDNYTSSIYVSHSTDYTASKIEIFGSKKTVILELENMLLIKSNLLNLTPLSIGKSIISTMSQMSLNTFENGFNYLLHKPVLGHDIMIKEFVSSVQNNTSVPVDPLEGRETVRALDLIASKLNS